ncbi:terpene synthase 10-like [Cucurbita moschata]|uniref:Terpene synthase 10-like n=1 Tax=Cucurbita moschata TaxID=3662 RepID=A0A6J1EJ26_CUCMO|nr:terpene synthase 10-like [Cucurbita moschata]XP_022928008.1 terpene synthase 10-like [Cucurbita moschata]
MALYKFLTPFMMNPSLKRVHFDQNSSFLCPAVKANSVARVSNQIIVRRSGNYKPPVWKHEYIQSLNSEFKGEIYVERFNELKEEVDVMINQIIDDPLKNLELIDTLQRLGISYLFENEIKDLLKRTYEKSYESDDWKKNNLYATSLEFRLLRQHGFNVSQEVFNNFMDETKNFNTGLYQDLNGMLSLYEASFLCIEGENILEAAKYFTINYLEKYMRSCQDEYEASIIRHALELPLHWRISRLEARWFIDIYERKVNMNSILLEIAKLDFNRVQSVHQEDLKYASRWWRNTGFSEKLSFARDRLMENFFWTVGFGFEPELSYFRRMSTKIIALITTIDDVYDVYGTLDELELFTKAVERWNVDAMDKLPDYMKICFLGLHNSINEMTFDVLRDKEINVIQYFKKTWIDLCKSYLLEAKCFHSGYKPTLEEYLDNAWISVGGPVVLVHAYVFVTSPMLKDMESLEEHIDIIRCSSTIVRLADDLATSTDELERGDVPKSIQCYMNDTGASENNAREHIKHLIDETWKKLNMVEVENSIFLQVLIKIAQNLARTAQCMFQFGDGHGIGNKETNANVMSLIVRPISIHPYSK